MDNEKQERCINIDWLEVYCLEPFGLPARDAVYFQGKGYMVRERPYGTRVYNQMFEILDDNRNPIIEVRRDPASGDSQFSGLVPESCHLRLPNWMLYHGNPIRFLMDFLLEHEYVFKRIFRIDIAYDFELFDSKDDPAKFVKRYLQGRYRKINQCSLSAHGEDSWNQCDWNSLSWGSRSSMVSTKLYNKTKELEESKTDKPYIRSCWMMAGLIDNPMTFTKRQPDGSLVKKNIWRLEFSMRSACDGWIAIDIVDGKKVKKQRIPHKLPLFDGKQALWQRFQDLCYHYFRFKVKEYVDISRKTKGGVLELLNSDENRPLKRKDRCRDKKLFYFDAGHQFTQVSQAIPDSKTNRMDDVLERRLRIYKEQHSTFSIRSACDVILKDIELNKLSDYTEEKLWKEAKALQLVLRAKMDGDLRPVGEIYDQMIEIIETENIY